MKNRFNHFAVLIRLIAVICLLQLTWSTAQAADRLFAGQTLYAGQSLYSPNGRYRLVMQGDGNLVIYDSQSGPIWHTQTHGTDADRLIMQGDGNLVVYSSQYIPRWHTHTHNNPNQGIHAFMQDDGNFVLYKSNGIPIWASKGLVPNTPRGIDRDRFFSGVRSQFGSLSQSQANGINFLISKMEADTRPATNDREVWLRQIAYIFATIRHEVANTYQPITEFSNTTCRRYDGGCLYKGRGYVQLTHRYNYRKMSPVVGVDLVASPTRALEPEISYTVTSYGMFNGSFTGKALGSYVRSGYTDYYNARRVVNGLDKASLIRGYANTFQNILSSSAR